MAEIIAGEGMAEVEAGQQVGLGDPPLPTVKPFVKPWMYSPQIAKTQQTTFNPMSTSHNYLARFGIAKHF